MICHKDTEFSESLSVSVASNNDSICKQEIVSGEMIVYLAQKYFINSTVFFVGLIIFPWFYAQDPVNLITKTIFWGGLFGGIYTNYDFRKKHLWPLYDNLNYSKYLLLLIFFILLQVLSLIINIVF